MNGRLALCCGRGSCLAGCVAACQTDAHHHHPSPFRRHWQVTADGVPVIWHDNYLVHGDPSAPGGWVGDWGLGACLLCGGVWATRLRVAPSSTYTHKHPHPP